jgi:uncharacterized protein (UPF0335 family)
MGRPKGSVNKPKDGNGGDEPRRKNSADGAELMGYIRRIEEINEEQKQLSVDRSQVYVELKTAGYDREQVREIVKRRKLTLEQRQERAAVLDMYLSAIGDFADTPLGQAGAERMRDDEAHETG